jgi:hypothetical protein
VVRLGAGGRREPACREDRERRLQVQTSGLLPLSLGNGPDTPPVTGTDPDGVHCRCKRAPSAEMRSPARRCGDDMATTTIARTLWDPVRPTGVSGTRCLGGAFQQELEVDVRGLVEGGGGDPVGEIFRIACSTSSQPGYRGL